MQRISNTQNRHWRQAGDRSTQTQTLSRLHADSAAWKLHIVTRALTVAERQHYQEALADFAARRGLQVYFSVGTTCIAPTDHPITSEDRGAVLGWLCAQSEVRFVHVQQRPSERSVVVACAPAGTDSCPRGPAQGLLPVADEDQSQEIPDIQARKEFRHAR